ncbi:MAG: hypothetical protein A2041_15025 [Bacteroidetes bacterium GWA2_31_9b]|nr:MAG: hypothetical protein A2041_15025 [Bacteroidetes bacterium GWA2_31_9b]
MSNKNFIIKINPSKSKKDNKVEIILENELTIYSIESMQDQILNTLEKHKSISINIQNVSNIDLSFIQFLYSLKITANEQSKQVELFANLTKEIQVLFSSSGISNFFNIKTI